MSYPNRYFLARLTIGSADEKTLFRGVYHGSLLIDPSGCGSNAVGYTEVPVYGTTARPRPAGPAGEHCPQAVPKKEIRSFPLQWAGAVHAMPHLLAQQLEKAEIHIAKQANTHAHRRQQISEHHDQKAREDSEGIRTNE